MHATFFSKHQLTDNLVRTAKRVDIRTHDMVRCIHAICTLEHGAFFFVIGRSTVASSAANTGQALPEAMLACCTSVFAACTAFFPPSCSISANARVGTVVVQGFE